MNWSDLFEKVFFGDPIEEVPSRPEGTWTIDYAIWRLWQAKTNNPGAVLDHAVLARQCLRWMHPRRIQGERLTDDEKSRLNGLDIRLGLSGYLEVEPYCPNWLGEGKFLQELDGLPQPACIDESFPAEEWLQRSTGKSTWRSHVQKEACWTVLKLKPGDTCLIGMPTGAGKSILFQVAAAFSSNGLTVVVVPTVSLGIDHLANAKALPTAAILNPATYSSGDGADAVRDAVANRECRLLFTSPEACVSGGLRSVLDKHARDGWLKWVVIDEAHIVESWGADFRVEFQLIGTLLRNWRQSSGNLIRTLLLSATFAESTQEILRGLFVERVQSWKVHIAQRLRAEIHYHIQRADTIEQQAEWVEEAIKHLPRPLILYVTEKQEAINWYRRITDLGFKRVECVHGDTNPEERKRIMDIWRSNCIDLIVATSAFGLGVDKPDIRAVIHACFPESIDRYYQEVGRGGRDGKSTQSILIYTKKDKLVGKSLAPKLLRPETVSERWKALWESRRVIDADAGIFEVSCSARRGTFLGSRTYQENIRWNKRLLQMLHRANLLTITGLSSEKVDDTGEYIEWARVEDLQFPSLTNDIGERLSADRDNELYNIHRGFEALERCTQGLPVCRELTKYYGGNITRACGSCRACRNRSEQRRICRSLQWPENSSPTNPKVHVVPMTRINKRNGPADWIMAIRKTVNQTKINRFFVIRDDFDLATSLLRDAVGLASISKPYRLDFLEDNHILLVGTDDSTVALHLSGFCPELGKLNRLGKACSHWMSAEQIEDLNGRSRFTQEHGARLFDAFETWLFENQRMSI